MSDFIPRVPDELRTVRLGMGYDTESGTVLQSAAAFHLGELDKRGYIVRGEGSLRQSVTAHASSSDIASNSFFNLEGEAKVSFWGLTASVNASMKTEQSASSSSFEENVVVQSMVEGEALQITGITAMTKPVYNSTFQGFRVHFDDVVKARTASEYLQAYETFTAIYGDSCITRINLIAGSALKVSLKKSTGSNSKASAFGAEAGVSVFGQKASVAANWGSNMQSQHSDGYMDVEVFHEPQSAGTAKFVNDLRDKYIDKGFKLLASTPPKFTPGKNAGIVRPTLPVPPEDGEEDEDPPEPGTSSDDIQKEIDNNDRKELDDQGKHDVSLPEHRKKTRKERDQLLNESKPGAIVREHNAAKKKGRKHKGVSHLLLAKKPLLLTKKKTLLGAYRTEVTGDAWSLGGFSPQSFKMKKWSELFPELKKEFPLTKNRIFLTRLWMFFLTRLEFLQYLQFLDNDFSRVWHHFPKAKNSNSKLDVTAFVGICEVYRQKIFDLVNKGDGDITYDEYINLLLDFDQLVDAASVGGTFASKKIYDFYWELYSEYFEPAPLGFILVTDKDSFIGYNHYWYSRQGQLVPALLRCNPVGKDVRRVFPMITIDGGVFFVFLCPPKQINSLDNSTSEWMPFWWWDGEAQLQVSVYKRVSGKIPGSYEIQPQNSADLVKPGGKLKFEAVTHAHGDLLHRQGWTMRGPPLIRQSPAFESLEQSLRRS